MHQRTLSHTVLATLLLVILGGVVIHAPLSVFFGSIWPEYALYIKAWKEVLLGVAAVVATYVATQSKLWPVLLRDRLLQLMVVYVALHATLLLVFWTGWQATVAGLLIDLRFIGYFMAVYILLRVAPGWRRPFIVTAIAGAAVVIGFGVLQLFLPHDILRHIGYDKQTTIAPYLTVDRNYDFIRINSTLRGPNPLGAYAAIVLAAIAAAMATGVLYLRSKKQLALTVAGSIAALAVLWVSYSRSALGGALIAVGLVGLIAYGKLIHRYVWISLIALMVITGGLFYVARDTDFVSIVILHEDPNEGGQVNSNDGHLESFMEGLDRMLRQPLGAGVGSTGSASLLSDDSIIIENHYLFVAHEVGWLGLVLFIGINGVVLWRLWLRRSDWLALGLLGSGLGIAAIGMLLPVWVDDTIALVWWGMAAVALAAPVRTVHKETA